VKIDFKDSISFKLTPYIYVLRVQLNDILSVLSQKSLGSLLFAESFLIQEGCFFLLTQNTPYFNIWAINANFSDKIQSMRTTIICDQLGKLLTKDVICDNCRVFFPQEKLSNYGIEMPVLKSRIVLFEKGVKIYNEQIGWSVVEFRKCEISVISQVFMCFFLRDFRSFSE